MYEVKSIDPNDELLWRKAKKIVSKRAVSNDTTRFLLSGFRSLYIKHSGTNITVSLNYPTESSRCRDKIVFAPEVPDYISDTERDIIKFCQALHKETRVTSLEQDIIEMKKIAETIGAKILKVTNPRKLTKYHLREVDNNLYQLGGTLFLIKTTPKITLVSQSSGSINECTVKRLSELEEIDLRYLYDTLKDVQKSMVRV